MEAGGRLFAALLGEAVAQAEGTEAAVDVAGAIGPQVHGDERGLALVAGALLFYSWVRNQIVHTGYENQSLFAAEESLLRVQERLALEEETLCHPERIDIIARNDLGMAPLHPSQLILPQIGDAVFRGSGEMAMMDSRTGVLKRVVAIKRPGDYSN